MEDHKELEIRMLKQQIAMHKQAAKMISRRPQMPSGGPEMARCDEFCKRLGLRPWDENWKRS